MSDERKGGFMGFLLPETLPGAIYRDMVIGNFCLLFGFSLSQYWNNGGLEHVDVTLRWPITLIALLIISAPLQIKMWLFGQNPLKFWRDYENVTIETSTGRIVSSDGGIESSILKFVVAVIMLYVGVAIQVIKLLYLPIKYAKCCKSEGENPPFIRSGKLIAISSIALFIVLGGIFAYSGNVHADKFYKGKYNAEIKRKSELSSAEIRSMLEEARTTYLAGNLEYSMSTAKPSLIKSILSGKGNFIDVNHNGKDNTTSVDISEIKPSGKYLVGIYHFKNGVFERFEDDYNTRKTPNAAQIEVAQAYTPQGIFNYFLSAKDSDLWSYDDRSGIKRIDVGWEKAIRMTFNRNDEFITVHDNNFPNPYSNVNGLRGVNYRLRLKNVAQ